jgi:hypothetical protein
VTRPGEDTGSGRIRVFDQPGDRAAECRVSRDVDLALCEIDVNNPVEDILFERLNVTPLNAAGSSLLLTGLGCTEPGVGAGKLRKLETTFTPLPPESLRIGENGQLCGGDSGGPAYLLASRGDHNGRRQVAGINFQNFDVTDVATPAAKRFIDEWRDAHRGLEICGLNTNRRSLCRP